MLVIVFLTIWTSTFGIRSLQDEDETHCLALNIYHESRSESRLSQFAVSQVVFNRVESSSWPDSVCGVIRQGHHLGDHPVRDRCQFSWYCDGRSDDPVDGKAWRDSVELASWMMTARGYLPQLVHEAVFYHADYVDPHWSRIRKRVLKVDSHIFYR